MSVNSRPAIPDIPRPRSSDPMTQAFYDAVASAISTLRAGGNRGYVTREELLRHVQTAISFGASSGLLPDKAKELTPENLATMLDKNADEMIKKLGLDLTLKDLEDGISRVETLNSDLAQVVESVKITAEDGAYAATQVTNKVGEIEGVLSATYAVKTDVDGFIQGFGLLNDGTIENSGVVFRANNFYISNNVPEPDGSYSTMVPFAVENGKVYANQLFVGLGNTDATRNVMRGDWQPNTPYDIGDVVVVDGQSYSCTTEHTSVSPFSETNWTLLAAKGDPVYTWVKYADDASGGGMSDSPAGKKYLGIAYNKLSAEESSTPSDYVWSLIKGDKGEPGAEGDRGSAILSYGADIDKAISSVTNSDLSSYWSSVAAGTQYTVAMPGDQLLVTNQNETNGWTNIWKYNGSAWVNSTVLNISGDAIVNGSLAASKLMSTNTLAGNKIFNLGAPYTYGSTTYDATVMGWNPTTDIGAGVFGFAKNTFGVVGWTLSGSSYGGYFRNADNTLAAALGGNGYAGLFTGNVRIEGNLTVTGTSSAGSSGSSISYSYNSATKTLSITG